MTLIGNLSTKQRMLFLLILVVCIAGFILTGVNSMRVSTVAQGAVGQEREDPRGQIDRMLDLASQNRTLALTAVQHDPRNSEAQFIAEPLSSLRPQVERNLNEMGEIQKAYLASSLTDEEQLRANRIITEHQAFVDRGLNPVFDAVEQDRFDEAKQAFYRQLEPAFARYREGVESVRPLYPDAAAQE